MIPNVFHFCYGLLPEAQFGFLEYLAIKSAQEVNRPERIYLHYQHECSGPWWDKAKELVTLNRVEAPREIFGRTLNHFAHRSDVVRLTMLREHGGIYMDIDTLCLRPFTPLLDRRCVLARQGGRGLCNAVILSEAGGQFLDAWLESYRTFRSMGKDHFWDEHSVVVPARLARQRRLRPHVTILNSHAFFPFWDDPRRIFESKDPAGFKDSYCLHYCESVANREWLARISPESISTEDTNFSRFARRVIEGKHGPEDRPIVAGGGRGGPVGRAIASLGTSLRKSRWLDSPLRIFRWLLLQARDVVWLPRLVRNLGWGPSAGYVVHRLRLRAGRQINAPFVLLRSKRAAHPLRCRGEHFTAFERTFIVLPYQCLDDVDGADLIVDCGASIGCASAYLLSRFPAARLIAVEPNPDKFSVLQANLAPYGERCRALCSAVWSHRAPLVLEETAAGKGSQWRRRVRPAKAGEAASLAGQDLGTLLEQSGRPRISILRMNIAGTESEVFASNCEPWLPKVDNIVIHLHDPACRSVFTSAIASEGYVVRECEHVTCCRRALAPKSAP